MIKNGKGIIEIFEFGIGDKDQYILSKSAYYKQNAYLEYIMNASLQRKVENDEEITQQDIKHPESINKMLNRTYDEYLEWKQTDEAKEIWENSIKDGMLRLLVNDFSNWTSEEEQKMNDKLDMIERDDYFKKLLIVEMNGRSKMILENPKSALTTITEEVEIQEIVETVEVPFSAVDQVPIMLGCQGLITNEERKTCMSKKIASHVNKNFNTDLAKQLGLIGKQRISVIFKIDTQGDVVGIRARAPHPELEIEAKRVLNLLPQFKPGIHKGKAVTVHYSLPILFQVASVTQKDKKN